MKIYTFGAEDAPVLLLLPGTCCHWKSNFGAVIPLLADSFRVLCVSYDGFDETEQTEFPTMLEETEKIEAYLKTHCGGHIRAAYGCSLGGSFVGLLAARQNIHMDCGILGSSDLDQASPLAARLQTDFLLPLIYPVVRDGKIYRRQKMGFVLIQIAYFFLKLQDVSYFSENVWRCPPLCDHAELQKPVLLRSYYPAAG